MQEPIGARAGRHIETFRTRLASPILPSHLIAPLPVIAAFVVFPLATNTQDSRVTVGRPQRADFFYPAAKPVFRLKVPITTNSRLHSLASPAPLAKGIKSTQISAIAHKPHLTTGGAGKGNAITPRREQIAYIGRYRHAVEVPLLAGDSRGAWNVWIYFTRSTPS